MRAETDRKTEHPGTGNQRADIDANLRQHHQRRAGKNHHCPAAAEERQQRLRAYPRRATAHFRAQMPLDQYQRHQPHRERHRQDQADIPEAGEQGMTER